MKKNWILGASIIAAGWLSTPAFSAVSFNLAMYKNSTTNTAETNVSTPIAYGSSAWGNTRTFTDNTVSATASALSGTGGTGGLNTQTLEAAYLPIWSGGLGVYNKDAANPTNSERDTSEFVSPEHALDNEGRADSILLDFSSNSQKIRLDTASIGWTTSDSDFFVLAYTGAGAPTPVGSTYANLTGWTLVGNYSNQGTGVVNLATAGNGSVINPNQPNIYSSFWLIGAGGFESGVGVTNDTTTQSVCVRYRSNGSCRTWGTKTVTSYDYIKLAAVGGTTMNGGGTGGGGGSAPEPGSLALAGLALLGMMGVRRCKAAA